MYIGIELNSIQVYRAYGVKQFFDGKILCDVAHPITMREVQFDDAFLYQYLKQLNEDASSLVDYMIRLEKDLGVDDHEAKELLRILTMRTWESLRCFKLVAFTSKVMLQIMFMPTYIGDDVWTHATKEKWSLGVRMRDSPVVETITISAIVIMGLLCTPATLSQILLTPDVFLIKRAVVLLSNFTEQHCSKEQKRIVKCK